MKRTDRTPKKSRRESGATSEPAAAFTGDARPRSRRAFLRLVAAGAGAMLAAPAGAAVKPVAKKPATDPEARTRRTRPETAGGHPMLPAELEKQKKYTAESLKTLRNYALPPGSAPAYVFRPLASKSRRGGRS